MSDIVPVLMVRNEEYWIRHVLLPLVTVFPHVLLGDTGSTDDTVAIAKRIDGVQVIQFGEKTPQGLSEVREALGNMVGARGGKWCLMVDGDELYTPDTLRSVAQALEGKSPGPDFRCGFVKAAHVDGDITWIGGAPHGDLWRLDDLHYRHAIYPAGDEWFGEYPFEGTTAYNDSKNYFYLEPPEGFVVHEYHLHRLARSRNDEQVYMRKEKQLQFCLRELEVPRVEHIDLESWLVK